MSIPEVSSRSRLLQFLKKYLLADNGVALGTTTITGDLSVTGDITVSDDLTVGDVIIQDSWQEIQPYGAGKGFDFEQYWEQGSNTDLFPAAFLKDSMAFVHLRGYAQGNNASAGATIFTLPTGYRPTKDAEYVVNSTYGAVRINVNSDGTVVASTGFTPGNAKWISINGITFDIR